jgi:hypothetical protein
MTMARRRPEHSGRFVLGFDYVSGGATRSGAMNDASDAWLMP